MPDDQQELAYDARQGYAKIVNEHMFLVSDARIKGNFYNWFKALEDLKTITLHNWRKPDDALANYKIKIDNIKKIANEYSGTWKNINTNQNEISLIETSLRELEEFVYMEMKKGKIFGESQRVEGLV